MFGQKVLLGFHFGPRKLTLVGKIHRFSVYDAGKIDVLPPENRSRNINFQIEGNNTEKLVIRVFYHRKYQIKKVLFYYLKDFDNETVAYIVKEQLKRLLKYSTLHDEFQLRKIDW